ncbi:MAG: TolC family protein, partial [Rhodoferax sp.]
AALASAQADREYLDAVRQRQHAGEDDGNAELTAELTMQRAQAELATRKAQRTAAEHALAAAIGVPLAALAGVTLEWPELTAPPAPTALPTAALSMDAAWNRLDLAILLQRYRAAETKLREAAGSRYPHLAIAPGYLYDQGQRKFTFGLEVELPLFHGAGARIRAAGAARDEAVAAVHARQDQIINQLDAARANYAQRYEAWRQLSAMAKSAQSMATRAAARRTAGQVDRLAGLAARAAAKTAQLNALDALSGTWNALGHLEDVLQRPLWPTSQLSMLQRTMAPSRSFPPSEVEAAHADAH